MPDVSKKTDADVLSDEEIEQIARCFNEVPITHVSTRNHVTRLLASHRALASQLAAQTKRADEEEKANRELRDGLSDFRCDTCGEILFTGGCEECEECAGCPDAPRTKVNAILDDEQERRESAELLAQRFAATARDIDLLDAHFAKYESEGSDD